MKGRLRASKVLVACSDSSDAALVARALGEWSDLQTSFHPDRSVEEFEAFKPAVVVLAFQTITLAQRYCLSLFRSPSRSAGHVYRTVLLCWKEEVPAAFDLCRDAIFDDYVLYWPFAQDALRLPMSVWNAAREVMSTPHRMATSEMLVAGERVRTLNEELSKQVAVGRAHSVVAEEGLRVAEQQVGSALESLAERLNREPAPDALGPAAKTLSRSVEALESDQLPRIFKDGKQAIAPLIAWPNVLDQLVNVRVEALTAFTTKANAAQRLILVVDDDPFARNVIANALSGVGNFRVVFAENATSAMAVLRSKPADLILMDVRLPDVDGISLTRQIKAAPQFTGIPVLMLTGESRREVVSDSLEAGAAGFIVKPFTTAALLAKIAAIIPS